MVTSSLVMGSKPIGGGRGGGGADLKEALQGLCNCDREKDELGIR